MRTTLNIEDDVLLAAKEIARLSGSSTGQVISRLVRQTLTRPPAATTLDPKERESTFGFRPFRSGTGIVTNTHVERLRDEEGV